MAADQHQAQAASIIVALHAAGLKLAVIDGDLDIGGTPKAIRVWHAMADAIENLAEIVVAALL
jgi:hypothetical protein